MIKSCRQNKTETRMKTAEKIILHYIEKLNYLKSDCGVKTKEIIDKQIRKFEMKIKKIKE